MHSIKRFGNNAVCWPFLRLHFGGLHSVHLDRFGADAIAFFTIRWPFWESPSPFMRWCSLSTGWNPTPCWRKMKRTAAAFWFRLRKAFRQKLDNM